MARHLQHVRSNVVINDQPKLPTSEQIEYGEIAINYAKDHETMSIKNGNNEIVTFTNDNGIKKLINEKVADVKNGDTSIVDENKVATLPTATTSGYGVVIVDDDFDSGSTNPLQNDVISTRFTEVEKVTAAALNDLNERKMEDVTISGTSIVNNKVADIPFATTDSYGVVIVDDELDTESTNPIQNGVISSFIERKEIVIAAALNDLNDKVTNLSANTTAKISNLGAIVGLENAPEFNITTEYLKDDLVIYDGKLYKFNVTHTAGAWNASQVTETSLFTEIQYILKNYQI